MQSPGRSPSSAASQPEDARLIVLHHLQHLDIDARDNRVRNLASVVSSDAVDEIRQEGHAPDVSADRAAFSTLSASASGMNPAELSTDNVCCSFKTRSLIP